MFQGSRPVGWRLSVLFGLASMLWGATARPPVQGPLCRPSTAIVPVSMPIVHVSVPSGVIAAARFISSRYRVPPAQAVEIAYATFRDSEAHQLNPYLVLAVIAVESSFRPYVVNRYGGAYGLMQIAVRVHERRVEEAGGARRLFMIAPNIRIGVALLAQYGAQARSNVRHALWRYSGGEHGYARRVLRLSAVLRRDAVTAHL